MVERLVVIGADAAGMSAASQAKRLRGDGLEVVAFERGVDTSYSACGIPYWVGGLVDSDDDLIARTPEEHRKRGIDLRMRHEVTDLDLAERTVTARDLDTGRDSRVGFDQLMIGTGAVPVRPPIEGLEGTGVYGVQTLADGRRLLDRLNAGSPRPKRVVVVGAGYIGVEMAEAMIRWGLDVTVVDGGAAPMSTLDPDMGQLISKAMVGLGIDLHSGSRVQDIERDGRGDVRTVHTDAGDFDADLVVLGVGVRPNTDLAAAAGLELGDRGGLRPDPRMRVPGADGVWAAGDCVESRHRITGGWAYVPLGTHANKQGRVAGTNIGVAHTGKPEAMFPGVIGTAITGVCDLEISRTGLSSAEAEASAFEFDTVTVESTTRAGYFPGAAELTVKIVVERPTGRLLGTQIVGREDAGKRVDAAAVAIWHEMTVTEVAGLDLGYAPPYAPVWDPLLIAARKAAEARTA